MRRKPIAIVVFMVMVAMASYTAGYLQAATVAWA